MHQPEQLQDKLKHTGYDIQGMSSRSIKGSLSCHLLDDRISIGQLCLFGAQGQEDGPHDGMDDPQDAARRHAIAAPEAQPCQAAAEIAGIACFEGQLILPQFALSYTTQGAL